VSYRRDWNRCWSFLTYASWAGTTPVADPLFAQNGESWQAAYRLTRYFHRDEWLEHGVRFGMDFKTSNTNLEFGGQQAFASSADVWQFVIGYQYLRRYRDNSYFVFDYDFYFSPGEGWSEGHNEAAYNTLRANTDPHYTYHRLWTERLWNLPHCWQFVARGTAQAASDRLLFSEMLGLGGYDSIRGYDQRTLNADHGWFANFELGPRPYQFCFPTPSQLRVYGFTDVGTALTIDPVPGEPDDITLVSVGAGMRLAVSNRLSLRLDLAEPLKHVPGLDTERTVHLGLVYRMGGPRY
jgi:hemolysin activation/secretion protein